jgi:carbon-monoxide dehydrogenase medium subunit
MYSFDYHRPDSVEAARSLFAGAEDPMYLSGGMTLIPSMKQRLAAPSDLIDLSGLQALQGIEHVESQGGTSIRVGALTRHNDVAANGLVLNQLPVLAPQSVTIRCGIAERWADRSQIRIQRQICPRPCWVCRR